MVVNRRELEYSVSGLMHPQYPAPDIKHLIDRLHAKGALRFLDLEISGPIELMPGVFCEAAGAHTEGSMNVHVHTAEGVATICGDVIYDINDQIVEPFRQNNDGEPQTTGNHGTTKRAEKGAIKKVLANARFILPVHDRPARVEGGVVVGAPPGFRCPARSCRRCPSAIGSRPDRIRSSPTMTHATLRPEFEDLIDPYAPVGQVGTGFTFTEGPIWHPVDHYLLFSDMPADVRRRWDAERGVVEVRRPSNKCNGMTYDADLNLIVCEHATSSLVRERPDGRREVLASHFEGQELNSPNDVCVRSDGSIYFSDPWYGRMPGFGVERPRQLGFQGVYRVPPGGGAPQLLVDRRSVRSAERPLLLAGREAPLRQRHRADADPRLRRRRRRLAVERAHLRLRHPLVARRRACPTA